MTQPKDDRHEPSISASEVRRVVEEVIQETRKATFAEVREMVEGMKRKLEYEEDLQFTSADMDESWNSALSTVTTALEKMEGGE